MNDTEEFQTKDILITKKQYKKLIVKMIVMITVPCVFVLIGGILAILASDMPKFGYEVFISGGVLFGVSFLIMLFNLFYSMLKYMPKLYLYRELKKHPENLNN